jgi:succinate dehydrogenase/fumarate reductase flavoprotein subunit
MDAVIVFTDIEFKEVGRVTVKDGAFSGDTPFARDMAENATDMNADPEQWVKKFASWSNGRYWSEKL